MFYDTLSDLCKKSNTSVTAVLKELGISTSKGTAWKNGSVPKGDILLKISNRFDVTTDYLIGKTPESHENLNFPPENTSKLTDKTLSLSDAEKEILKIFRSLNTEGRDYLLNTAQMCSENSRYKKRSEVSEEIS